MQRNGWVLRVLIATGTILILSFAAFANPVVIRFMGGQGLWEAVIDEFNESQSEIFVEFEPYPGGWYETAEQLKVQMVAGVAPDVVAALGIMVTADFRDTDLAIDMKPYIERDPDFSLDELFPSAWEFHEKEGRLAAIPVFLHTLTNWANVDRYNEAGIALPDLDWETTWDEEEFVLINQRASRMWNYDVIEFEWAATPLPRGTAGNATSVYPDPMLILSTTDHPDEAWEVVKFMLSERAAEIINVGIPANRNAAINLLPNLLSRQPLENKMVIIHSLEFAKAPPVTPNWREITEMVEGMVQPIRRGEQHAASVMPEIARQVNLLLDELEQ